MTYSIVALDPATGDLGVAVQSKFLAVGAVVPWARAGVGAVATQAFANVAYGPDGLGAARRRPDRRRRRCAGSSSADDLRDHRQVGIVDAQRRCRDPHRPALLRLGRRPDRRRLRGAGQHPGRRRASSTASPTRSSPAAGRSRSCSSRASRRPTRRAAIGAVASRRRCWSSATAAATAAGNDRWIDLRVDHHDDPIGELARLVDLQRLYFERPTPAELAPIDEATAAEIRGILERLGAGPGGRFGAVYTPMSGVPPPSPRQRPSVGEPRALPPNWDATWQRALDDWMSVENLEERAAASGWIDPRVLEILRATMMERLSRVVGPAATNVHILADPRSARGDRHRHRDPVAGLDRRRARRARLDAQADRLDPWPLGPHRRQRRGRRRTPARRSPSIRSTASG